MSGGSFGYLAFKDADDLPNQSLREMAEALRDLGFEDAAQETERYIRPEPDQALKDLWHAVEWYCSGDYGKDRAQAEYQEYQAARKAGSDATE